MENAFRRVVAVLFSPSQVFESIRQSPTWLVALLTILIVGLVGTALINPKIDYAEMIEESIEAQGRNVPAEQMERIIDFYEKFGPVMSIAGSFIPVVGFLLIAVLFLVVLKLFGGELSFAQSFSTTVHAMMPQAVKGLLTIPVILGKSDFSYLDLRSGSILKSNLGAFASEETGPAMLGLLSSLDLFTLWSVALLVIGYSIVGRVSKSTATLATVGLWVLWILIKVGFASLGGGPGN